MRPAPCPSTPQRALRILLTALAIGLAPAGPALAVAPSAQTLYDAASGVLPHQLPWQWSQDGSGTFAMDPGGYASLTTTTSQLGGYNLYGAPTLDRTAGFRIEFDLKMVAEAHTSNDRSGTSLIVLDSQARGVELSFWENKIFTKNANLAFSQGESVAIDTKIERRYTLDVSGNTYQLSAPGMTPLSGSVRNYYGDAADNLLEWFVYGQTNYLFFGDNTSSASAQALLRSVTLAPVPEPSQWLLMLGGLAVAAGAGLRKSAPR